MRGKTLGTVLGVVGAFVWYMPLLTDGVVYQTGEHIGGIAYLLLAALLTYSVLTWTEQHIPRVIAASLALTICLLILVQAGNSAGWGLIVLTGITFSGVVLAARDIRASGK